MGTPLRTVIFFHDVDQRSLGLLEAHLFPLERENLLDIWHRGRLSPGENITSVAQKRLHQAELVLLLISADFNAEYDSRISPLMSESAGRRTCVVPIIARPCLWNGLPYYGLKPLPSDERPLIIDGRPDEEQFHRAVKELRDRALEFVAEREAATAPPIGVPPAIRKTLVVLEQEVENAHQVVDRTTSSENSVKRSVVLIWAALLVTTSSLVLLAFAIVVTDRAISVASTQTSPGSTSKPSIPAPHLPAMRVPSHHEVENGSPTSFAIDGQYVEGDTLSPKQWTRAERGQIFSIDGTVYLDAPEGSSFGTSDDHVFLTVLWPDDKVENIPKEGKVTLSHASSSLSGPLRTTEKPVVKVWLCRRGTSRTCRVSLTVEQK